MNALVSIIVAVSLAASGSTLIRTNLGRLIPFRGASADPVLPSEAAAWTDPFTVDQIAQYSREWSSGATDAVTWSVAGDVLTGSSAAGWTTFGLYGLKQSTYTMGDGYIEVRAKGQDLQNAEFAIHARAAAGTAMESGFLWVVAATANTVFERVGAAWTSRATETRALANNTYYTLRLMIVDRTIITYIDGVERLRYDRPANIAAPPGPGLWGVGMTTQAGYVAGTSVTVDSITIQPSYTPWLSQWAEGVVTVEGAVGKGADRHRVYLNTSPGLRGTKVGDFTPGQTFDVPKGVLRYARIVAYDSVSGQEVFSPAQRPLQMYESIVPNYRLGGIFHDRDGVTIWALAHNTGADKTTAYGVGSTLALLKSTDGFSTFSVVKTWTEGTDITTGSNSNLAMWVDKYGFIYVPGRPNPKISKDGGTTWSDLTGVVFDYSAQAILAPFWSFSEDEGANLITISEYGGSTTLGQRAHSINYSTDATRTVWSAFRYPQAQNWIHIHSYLISPYNRSIHLFSPGDPIASDNTNPGLYVSTNGGVNGGTMPDLIAANDLTTGLVPEWVNGPTHATWWPDGTAFVIADQAGASTLMGQFGRGGVWTPAGYQKKLQPSEIANINGFAYSAAAVRASYETYVSTALDGTNPAVFGPQGVFRYDGDTGRVLPVVKSSTDSPLLNPRYLGATVGGLIPAKSPWVFSTYGGGIRIPRAAAATEPVIP